MKLQQEVPFVLLISLCLLQLVLCDEISNSCTTIRWTCLCSLNQRDRSNFLESNCLAPCDCTAVGGTNGERWRCTCDGHEFPKLASESKDTGCFSACNCTSKSGLLYDTASSGMFKSIKVVVVAIILCGSVLISTVAFLTSIICYLCRTNSPSVGAPVFSVEKESSFHSDSNLIYEVNSSNPKPKANISSAINPFTACFRKASSILKDELEIETIYGSISQFSYTELVLATNTFSATNLIGIGGSSRVYRGQLKDGRFVAVKRLKDHGGLGANSLFTTEVDLLSRLNHCHVVPLLGYCSELNGKHVERLLVFEYVAKGNLRDCLDVDLGENMNWETRVAIAIGAARGLEYLHEAAAPRVLHRDVKSTNILLDENWRAKITDLGMAKYLKADGLASFRSSASPGRMLGTFGYFAPEYAIIGKASLKSDVFSFGVVLLELITGRHPIQKSTSKGGESLVIWATPRLQDSRRVISELPDPRLKENFPEEEFQIMAYLAKECLLLDPDSRPTMSEVVQILSTVAPDRSRTRNIHADLFQLQFSSSNISRPEANSEFDEHGQVDAQDTIKAVSERWSPPCSLQVSIDESIETENIGNSEVDDLSCSDNMELPILQSSIHTNRGGQGDSEG